MELIYSTFLINPLIPIVHFWLHHAAHCTEKIVTVCLCAGSASAERVGQRGGGWGRPHGDTHMVAARLAFERVMVGKGWATSCPDCLDRLTKYYSRLVGS